MSSETKQKKGIRKSKYSRGGCQECRRRKIKCDEAKPYCYNCTRLSKNCSYPTKPKYKFEEPKVVSLPIESPLPPPTIPPPPPTTTTTTSTVNVRSQPVPVHAPFPPIFPHSPAQKPMDHLQPASKRYKISDILSPDNNDYSWGELPVSDLQTIFGDASLLVHDSLGLFTSLNDQRLTTKADDDLSFLLDFPIQTSISDTNTGTPTSNQTSANNNNKVSEPNYSPEKNSQLIMRTLNKEEVSGPHQFYLDKLTNTSLGFNLFPFAESVENNEVLKILLKYSDECNYLLLSLLASSSAFQFIQTNKPTHKENQIKYTNACLKYLSDAFPSNQKTFKDENNSNDDDGKFQSMINNIEKLLLTILVLTLNYTALAYYQRTKDGDIPRDWKTHLRGVKDLLLKYTKLAQTNKNHYLSDGLALAKTWFFAIESVAELHDPYGGTIKYLKKNISMDKVIIRTDQELDVSDMSRLWLETGYFNRGKNQSYHDALLRIGLLTNSSLPISTQFNIFNGYSIDVVRLIDEMTKNLDLLRDNLNNQISGSRIATIFSFIDKAKKNEIVPKVNKDSFRIPSESIAHPDYNQYDFVKLPKSCYACETTPSGEKVYYSWYDWSEQMHIDTVYMKLFSIKGLLKLPKTHPLVQELKQKVITGMFFVKKLTTNVDESKVFLKSENYYLHSDLFDTRAVMSQSTFRACTKIANDLNDFEILKLYFEGLVKLGNGSALFALEKLERLKKEFIENDNEAVSDNDEDCENNIIPFA
ncbi:LYS14 Lysine biosynthesis regulatory protein LYS14 [Candida maltosa Xu316]